MNMRMTSLPLCRGFYAIGVGEALWHDFAVRPPDSPSTPHVCGGTRKAYKYGQRLFGIVRMPRRPQEATRV
jgi:hypothetical protein